MMNQNQKWFPLQKKSIISEYSANIILQDKGNPTITRKEDGSKWLVMDKRLFEFSSSPEQTTLFIIVDCQKQ